MTKPRSHGDFLTDEATSAYRAMNTCTGMMLKHAVENALRKAGVIASCAAPTMDGNTVTWTILCRVGGLNVATVSITSDGYVRSATKKGM